MIREPLIVQRARDFFGPRVDEVVRMVEQDRQDLHGWEEPAHLRAVLRRAIRERTTPTGSTAPTAITEAEIGQGAAEPDKGQQREALGQILETGAAVLKKTQNNPTPELTLDELFALVCVVLLYGRPGLLLGEGKLAAAPAFWRAMEDQRQDIEMTQRSVGRIELVGHPNYDWAGTGFLVGETCLMTTRTIAQEFAERSNDAWHFRPGISAWMDYQPDYQRPTSATYRVAGIIGVHDKYDLAVLEVEAPQQNGAPASLTLAAEPPPQLEGQPVYLISYPVRDSRRNTPEALARVFRDDYNVKRIQPGLLRGLSSFRDVHILRHDCAPLGHSAGGCLVDLTTHEVLGLHTSGRYLENGTAVPLWMLRDDPFLRRWPITFATASAQERETTKSQLERLTRSRFWGEAREAIAGLYAQAFGTGMEPTARIGEEESGYDAGRRPGT